MKREGTKITYKSIGTNPDGDNRINVKTIPKLKSKREINKHLKNKDLHLINLTDSEAFAFDKLTYNRKMFFLQEPNPVTFYFSTAFDMVSQFEKVKQQLETALKTDYSNERLLEIIYSGIFKIGSIGVIFSFLAIEAFMNQELPDHKEIDFRNKKRQKSKSSDEQLLRKN